MSDAPRRIDMTAELTVRPRVMMQGLRRPTSTDIEPLGELMHAAYAGTVDDHGASADEALREIEKTFGGDYGSFLPQHSQVVERNGRLVSATLVTRWRDRPFVAYTMTRPEWQRNGLARNCMVDAMRDALLGGDDKLSLVVTLANEPALRLFQQLRFVPGW